MSPSATSFVDPSSLSLPSPSPSSSTPAPESQPEPGPSRKRARTESSSEDRKEARAHRNRIAAQNSRDRRKAQFSYLQRRVDELEEENRQLRAGMGVVSPISRIEEQKAAERERDKTRERENEELRERIKTLEKGWDAVVKALAAQGLPTGIPSSTPKSESAPPSQIDTSLPPTSSTHPITPSSPTPQQNPTTTTTFPVLVPPTTVFPISPAPSHSSLDFDFDLSTSDSNPFSSEFPPVSSPESEHEHQSTRHLARVAYTEAPPASMSLQRVDSRSRSLSHMALRQINTMIPRNRRVRSTMQLWKTCSGRSSPLPPPSRRRVYLMALACPSMKSRSHQRRQPPPRK
jgi:cell division protein FtsB